MSDFNKYLEERQQKKTTQTENDKQEKLEWDSSVQALYAQIKEWFANQQYVSISESKIKHGGTALVLAFNNTDAVTIDPKEIRLQTGWGIKVTGPKGNYESMVLNDKEWFITDAGPFKGNIEFIIPGGREYKKEPLTQRSFEQMIKNLID